MGYDKRVLRDKIPLNSKIISVNDEYCQDLSHKTIFKLLRKSETPVKIRFSSPQVIFFLQNYYHSGSRYDRFTAKNDHLCKLRTGIPFIYKKEIRRGEV